MLLNFSTLALSTAGLSLPVSIQVFLPSDSMGAEAVVGAGICIASTDLLFTDRTIEQACISPASSPCYLLWQPCLTLCSVYMLLSRRLLTIYGCFA